ncbi:hypothetical protein EVAR_87682_1 [Eumeta japonica]|uniref:Uncharacterized protein n=1 Tax=Eumeta variegata TaxID=151549 RepID=A0A4C1XNA6_EUMVA|nr:hypothetical protein EVAR_87682_1 [Eumeta japonica]
MALKAACCIAVTRVMTVPTHAIRRGALEVLLSWNRITSTCALHWVTEMSVYDFCIHLYHNLFDLKPILMCGSMQSWSSAAEMVECGPAGLGVRCETPRPVAAGSTNTIAPYHKQKCTYPERGTRRARASRTRRAT